MATFGPLLGHGGHGVVASPRGRMVAPVAADATPDPLRRVEALMDIIAEAHAAIFTAHRQMVTAGHDDEHARDLLRESANLTMRKAPRVARVARSAAQDHAIAQILDPETPATDAGLSEAIAAAERTLTELLRRQQEIADELVARVRRCTDG